MTDERERALQELSDIGQEMETQRILHESAVDDWWNNLHEDEREWAFYAVVKRIHQAEIIDKAPIVMRSMTCLVSVPICMKKV